jgi:hypothetical protein
MSRPARQRGPQMPETPLMTLHRVWRLLSNEDRARFLVEMLTPAERLLVASSLVDDAYEEEATCP